MSFKLYIKRGTEKVRWETWREEPTRAGAERVAAEMARAYRHPTKVVNSEGHLVAKYAAGSGRRME
ncbi:MAG: hypothetical protein KGI89_03110 [Euryarchaeota archaeon]|nr:hypothetical protein [Euryarchaeota archaeon]